MNTILGKRIRALREEKNLTQEEVAGHLGVSRQKLARMENGKCDITFTALDKLAELFGITVPEITAAVSNKTPETAYRGWNENTASSLQEVMDLLDLFYANKHIYEKVRK